MKRITGLAATLLVATLFVPAQSLADKKLHENAGLPFVVAEGSLQAPFGEVMPDVVRNYGRAAPAVGTGGMISDGAMRTFESKGFRTVVSLLTSGEGVDVHAGRARSAGISYYNLGVTPEGPDDSVLEAFKEIMADPENYPVMVHCSSANRVGALWARYRIDMGVPVEVAFQEGRTIGLQPDLEATVRERFGY